MNKTLQYYTQNAADFIASTKNVDMSSIQNEFISLLSPSSLILDLGCGSGRDSLAFLEKGFSVDAIDACKEFCDATKRLTSDFMSSIQIFQMDFSELSAAQKYDGVWACSSLLHVSKKELPQILKKIEEALKADGIFYCSFKWGNFEGERNGRYFSDFTENELCSLIERTTDFKKIRIWQTKDARPERNEIWINSLWKK